MYGDMPKFVTSAYKKKLQEAEKWDYEDKLASMVEEKTSSSAGGMMGFYKNLLTRNIAMGGDVETSATSAYTAGSQRQRLHVADSVSKASDNLSGMETGDNNSVPTSKSSINAESTSDKSAPQRNTDRLSSIDRNEVKEVGSNISIPSSSGVFNEKEENQESTANTEVSKASALLSARERYLARKKENISSSTKSIS
jgi:coiled-coil domain-containing protein 55